MRTTVDIDDPVLRELKKLKEKERKSLGRLVSDLLAQALRQRQAITVNRKPSLRWISKAMGARVDLADKEALYGAMEREPQPTPIAVEE